MGPEPKKQPLVAYRSSGLSGTVAVPADKSISHRAVMLASIAVGESVISNLLESEDIISSIKAMAAFGARIERWSDDTWHIRGCGLGGLQSPEADIDFGNAGTGVRLACGLIATTPVSVRFTGDASLSKRPMGRIIEPLQQMGCEIEAHQGTRLPMIVTGAEHAVPIVYHTPVPSAQVKSAVLLAGLNAPGETIVIEREATRDHTERMLRGFGIDVCEDVSGKGHSIAVRGHRELSATKIDVPGDPSSAAFPLVAALICPDSEIRLPRILLNEGRIGLIKTLLEMGADITILDETVSGGERIGTIRARTSDLKGVKVPAERAPSMIDEYPILAIAAAYAEGTTRMEGLAELRVKESDRLSATLAGLVANGVSAEAGEDWIEVTGGTVAGGGLVETRYDHRIAMSFLVFGLNSAEPVMVDDGFAIATSFPDFVELMSAIGAHIEVAGINPS